MVLAPYGSLFFAAAPVFKAQLPQVPSHCERTVVIIRLRGKEELGSTFIKVVEQYAAALDAAGGALMLVGVSVRARKQLTVTGVLAKIGADRVFDAQSRVGDSLTLAMEMAQRWSAGPPTT